MRRSVTVVTPPASTPASLAELKELAKIDTDDEDASLTLMLEAATAAAEEYTRRAFVSRTLKLTLDAPANRYADYLGDGVYDLPVTALLAPMPRVIELTFPPVSSVDSVTAYGTDGAATVMDPSDYTSDATRLILNGTAVWPALRAQNAIEVVYRAGYGLPAAVPAPIRQAILMHAAAMYEADCDCPLLPQCERLLRQYKVFG